MTNDDEARDNAQGVKSKMNTANRVLFTIDVMIHLLVCIFYLEIKALEFSRVCASPSQTKIEVGTM